MPTIPTGSRPIVMTEIDQFGGAESSVVALSRWLYKQGRPNHVVVSHARYNLAKHATHPLEVVELNPASGPRNKIAALRRYFRQHPAPKPLLSGYQPALHATL